MTKKDLFTIGEISEICRVSQRTLRYYDELGLVKPAWIDHDSGYRYYSQRQIFLISLIQDLKSFDFSLKEIEEALKRENFENIQELYQNKLNEIENEIAKLSQSRQRLFSRKNLFQEIFLAEENLNFNTRFQLKYYPRRKALSIKSRMGFNDREIILKVTQVQKMIDNKIEGAYFIIFHESYEKPDDTEMEIGTFISRPEEASKTPVKEIPEGFYASAVHKGDHFSSLPVYQQLLAWIQAHGYQPIGMPMKVYIKSLAFVRKKEKILSEIQIQVIKK
ncbi:MAG TPA: hypothetical protein DHW82_09005 [Spirochaetia bacterium]|nr:MAG: hypothetical protein A2Y41_06245 [Spirochaetes bacterium GWB1_36_13]HCL57128.1 hypothetical protein [Spirochaetia bacterium]